jgi:hypothetical protein
VGGAGGVAGLCAKVSEAVMSSAASVLEIRVVKMNRIGVSPFDFVNNLPTY